MNYLVNLENKKYQKITPENRNDAFNKIAFNSKFQFFDNENDIQQYFAEQEKKMLLTQTQQIDQDLEDLKNMSNQSNPKTMIIDIDVFNKMQEDIKELQKNYADVLNQLMILNTPKPKNKAGLKPGQKITRTAEHNAKIGEARKKNRELKESLKNDE